MKQEYIKKANKSCRNNGAINPVLPAFIEKHFPKNISILDFGAGTNALQAKHLISKGFSVTAHDFGANVTEVHDPQALNKKYDLVYASNVLNVQSTRQMLHQTLKQIHSVTKGDFICNYPSSPRYLGLSISDMEKELSLFFHVERQEAKYNGAIWKCKSLTSLKS
jgi:hypothetical protein